MKRDHFIMYLTEVRNCIIVRDDKSGYSIIRNPENDAQSGVPKNDPLRAATVCRICKTLHIDSPDEAKSAQGIIDIADKHHSENSGV